MIKEGIVTVLLTTSLGEIKIELNKELAPITTQNFVKYVESGFYDQTIFHRVIENFVIQGGGHNEDMSMKDRALEPIQNEANNGLKNERGSIAMARTAEPHSASSQFFINLQNNFTLNHTSETSRGWGYAVFGKVSEGMDVVDKIAMTETGVFPPHTDVPVEPILILKASIVE